MLDKHARCMTNMRQRCTMLDRKHMGHTTQCTTYTQNMAMFLCSCYRVSLSITCVSMHGCVHAHIFVACLSCIAHVCQVSCLFVMHRVQSVVCHVLHVPFISVLLCGVGSGVCHMQSNVFLLMMMMHCVMCCVQGAVLQVSCVKCHLPCEPTISYPFSFSSFNCCPHFFALSHG